MTYHVVFDTIYRNKKILHEEKGRCEVDDGKKQTRSIGWINEHVGTAGLCKTGRDSEYRFIYGSGIEFY